MGRGDTIPPSFFFPEHAKDVRVTIGIQFHLPLQHILAPFYADMSAAPV